MSHYVQMLKNVEFQLRVNIDWLTSLWGLIQKKKMDFQCRIDLSRHYKKSHVDNSKNVGALGVASQLLEKSTQLCYFVGWTSVGWTTRARDLKHQTLVCQNSERPLSTPPSLTVIPFQISCNCGNRQWFDKDQQTYSCFNSSTGDIDNQYKIRVDAFCQFHFKVML